MCQGLRRFCHAKWCYFEVFLTRFWLLLWESVWCTFRGSITWRLLWSHHGNIAYLIQRGKVFSLIGQNIICLLRHGRISVRTTLDRAVWDRVLAGNIVLCSWARLFSLTVSLFIQVYKWGPANLYNAGGYPDMDHHPIQGGVEIPLVASCYSKGKFI